MATVNTTTSPATGEADSTQTVTRPVTLHTWGGQRVTVDVQGDVALSDGTPVLSKLDRYAGRLTVSRHCPAETRLESVLDVLMHDAEVRVFGDSPRPQRKVQVAVAAELLRDLEAQGGAAALGASSVDAVPTLEAMEVETLTDALAVIEAAVQTLSGLQRAINRAAEVVADAGTRSSLRGVIGPAVAALRDLTDELAVA